MKQLILDTAVALMQANGSTSTLEVKNKIHADKNDPTFTLYQNEVSKFMRTLAHEEGWKHNFNGQFIVYKLDAIKTIPVPAAHVQVSSTDPMVGYLRTNDKIFVTGSDKNDVRRKLFALANGSHALGISYDDINTCTADYFRVHHN